MNIPKDKQQLIHNMCMTYRHDYGLRKLPSDPSWVAGMTEEDAKMLYKTMEQIYNNDIEPMIGHYERLYRECEARKNGNNSN